MLIPRAVRVLRARGHSRPDDHDKAHEAQLHPKLEVQGIVLTMYDSRTNFSEQVAQEVQSFFGTAVYKTRIPRAVRIAESPSHGQPVIKYDRMSRGSRAYLHLAAEF